MLRGFITTFGIVSAVTLAAWAYTDQSRMAGATPAEMTPSASSPTTNSNRAAKGDRLDIGMIQTAGINADGAMDRIVGAHAKALEAAADGSFMTVEVPSGHNESTLVRVPIRD